MARLPTPPATLRLRDADAVESRSPERHRPLDPPPASGSRRREPSPPPSSRRRPRSPAPSKSRSPAPSRARRRSRSPSPYRARRRSGSPSPSRARRRSRSPSKARRRSRSPLPSRARRRSRSQSPSRARRRSRSPPPSKSRRRSRSPSPSRARHRSRSQSPSRARRRSRSPPPSRARRRSRSQSPSRARGRSRSPPPSKARRRSRSPSKARRRSRSPSKARRRSRSPSPSRARRQSRSPPYASTTQRLAELQHGKRPSTDAAVNGREEGDTAGPSPLDEALVENRPSGSHCSCKHSETSSAAVEKRSDPAIRGDEQELHSEKMDGKNQSDQKAPSRNARRKWMRRRVLAEAKNQMREMKRDKLLEKIKKLQDCIWLLEKDGEDMAEIMELRSLLESTKKQYEENEAQLAKEGSSASHQVLNKDRQEKTHVETMPAPVEKVEKDEQNMDSGEAEGRSLKGCKAVSDENELAVEANRLKSEVETARQDRDYQSTQAQSLMADMAKQKEVARRYGVELEDAMKRVATLEEVGLKQGETIRTLQVQLASANEKLTDKELMQS